MVSDLYKKKLFSNGYNVLECRMIGGKVTICVMLYITTIGDFVCVITSLPDHVDPYNTMLFTCEWGTKLRESELKGFFPNYEKLLKLAKKHYPSHFREN